MAYEELMQRLSEEMSVVAEKHAFKQAFNLTFGDQGSVTFLPHLPHFFYFVGKLQIAHYSMDKDNLKRLLQMNTGLMVAREESLAIDEKEDQLVLYRQFENKDWSYETFKSYLKDFINAMDFWRDRVVLKQEKEVKGGA